MEQGTPRRPDGDEKHPEARRAREARRQRQRLVARRRRRALIASICGLVIAGLVALGFVGGGGRAESAPGQVKVAGVDVSGLDARELTRRVLARARELMAAPITITRGDRPDFRLTVTKASLGATPDVGRAVAEALEQRTLGGRVLAGIGVGPTREVPLRFSLDDGKLDALVARVAGSVNRPARAAALRVSGDQISLVPARAGYGIDLASLRGRLADLPDAIEVTPGPLGPPVSDAAAERARQIALRVVSGPVSLTYQGRSVGIGREVLLRALRFRARPPALAVALDPDVLHEDVAAAFAGRETAARDAGFRVNGSRVRLVPARIGRRLDMDAIASAIVSSPETRTVAATFLVTRPKVSTAEMRALAITDQVSEFQTFYPCCEPRVTNIKRAAEILDGMIVPAGGRFSLNQALGRRTVDRGFVEAPQIAAGKLEDAIGGGVSQVATTLYNAAFFAGLDLVEHTPHGFYIARYPKGREATVSYGGPELVFVNDWKAAILISAVATDGSITIRFFSSPLGRRIETTTGESHDPVEPRIREIPDPDLEPGAREVEQTLGGAGFTISYTRKVWQGTKLRRDERFTWRYSPQDAFVKVGPPKPKPKPDRDRRTRTDTTTAPSETAPPSETTPGEPTTAAPPPPEEPSDPGAPPPDDSQLPDGVPPPPG